MYWEGEGYRYKQRLCDLPISGEERTWDKELSQSPPHEDGVPCLGHETPAWWLCEVGSPSPILQERKCWPRGLGEVTQLVSGRSSSLSPAPMGGAKTTCNKKCCSGVCPALPVPQEAGPCAEGGGEPLMVSELGERWLRPSPQVRGAALAHPSPPPAPATLSTHLLPALFPNGSEKPCVMEENVKIYM